MVIQCTYNLHMYTNTTFFYYKISSCQKGWNAHEDGDVVIKHVVVPPGFSTSQALSFLIQATAQVANYPEN